ncbi:MAG: tetratricopeptide repeat protein [Anaerolineales bacterium]|nr:tetratricopeptide repeat protein [Anaerolineales bacterium]
MLNLSFLGTYLAEYEQMPVKGFESTKVRALLAYLVLESEKPHTREHLIGLLWGDSDDLKAAKSMRQALSNLRKTIKDVDAASPFLLVEADTIQLNKENSTFQVDAQVFENLINACEKHSHRDVETCTACAHRFEKAASLYRGELLQGFLLKDSEYFQDWLVSRREYFHQKMLMVLDHLARYHQRRYEFQDAISYARRLVSMDRWREEAHVLLMRFLSDAGQRSAALKQYQECCDMLSKEFGVEPQPETVNLYEQILNNQASAKKPVAPINNLPSFGTTFVGRKDEILEIVEYLQDRNCRLATITGTGGVGKTRLALQVGQGQLYAYQDGVFWIPLDAIKKPEELPGIVAGTLGLELPAKGDIQTHVINFLRHRDVLLILDNYEHLLPETDFITGILSNSSGVSILATSREVLHLQIEKVFELTGLPLSSEGKAELPSAVLLLKQRAERIASHVQISTQKEQEEALHLCSLLDGLPLGIELASGMLKTHTCAEIAEKITEDVSALSSSLRDIPMRHRSLLAVFEYSWGLLSTDEKRAFASLGVFPAYFTLSAAKNICDISPDVLDELYRKSLVRHLGKDLYGLHPLMQQYARKKQEMVGISGIAINKRFQSYYSSRTQQWLQNMRSGQILQALDHFSREWGNLTSCWNMAIATQDINLLNEYLAPFFWFFEIKGRIYEGESLFRSALDMLQKENRDEPLLDVFYHRLLTYYGWLSFRRGQTDIALNSLREVVNHGLENLDVEEKIFALNHYGSVCYENGQKESANEMHEKAMRLCKNDQTAWEEALTLNHYGSMLSMESDLANAEKFLRQGLKIADANQFIWITASVLSNLAVLAYFQQDYETAISLFLQSNEKSAQYGDLHRSPSVNHNNLAECYAILGELDKARVHLEQALYHFNECGNTVFLPYVYNTLAIINLQSKKYDEARQALDDGIKSAVENQMLAVLNNLLIDYAKYFLRIEQRERAVELIHYVSHSSYTIKEGHDKAAQLFEEFGENLRKEVDLLSGRDITQQGILDMFNMETNK